MVAVMVCYASQEKPPTLTMQYSRSAMHVCKYVCSTWDRIGVIHCLHPSTHCHVSNRITHTFQSSKMSQNQCCNFQDGFKWSHYELEKCVRQSHGIFQQQTASILPCDCWHFLCTTQLLWCNLHLWTAPIVLVVCIIICTGLLMIYASVWHSIHETRWFCVCIPSSFHARCSQMLPPKRISSSKTAVVGIWPMT